MNISNLATPALPAASGMSKPAALGIHDLQNLAGFVKSASSLGLADDGASKAASFLEVAAGAAGLISSKLTTEMAANCLNAGANAGLLSPTATLDQVSCLLGTAQALGVTPGNIQNRVAAIMDKAQKNGLNSADKESESLGPAITAHKLRFEPFVYAEILEVGISQTINDHARLYVKGVLQPAREDKVQQTDDQNIQDTSPLEAAALYSIDEQGRVECLFQGNILKVIQTQKTDLKYFEVYAVSPSYNLDISKKSRSFQKTTSTYDDVIKIITSGAAEVNNRTDSKPIGKLIIQHKESDWEFLKRLASHFNTGLVPVVNSEKVQIYFGVPIGQEAHEITAAAYKVHKNLGEYQTTTANSITHSNPRVTEADFTCYEVESIDRHRIGDCITFLSHTLYIRDVQTSFEQGMIKHRYTLVSKEGLLQKDLFNPALSGISLMAEVKVITKDQIKAHITEIDEQWDEANDWYFPYSTIFSSPDGSGWYAMPEPGDTVRIYFMNNKEENAIAASSVHRTSEAPEKRSNPDNKSLSNIHGKEVLFTPDGIYITNQVGKIFINLTDTAGISIMSEKDINITAAQNIVITAGKDLILTADDNLKLNCGPATIQSDKSGLIDIQGEQVQTN